MEAGVIYTVLVHYRLACQMQCYTFVFSFFFLVFWHLLRSWMMLLSFTSSEPTFLVLVHHTTFYSLRNCSDKMVFEFDWEKSFHTKKRDSHSLLPRRNPRGWIHQQAMGEVEASVSGQAVCGRGWSCVYLIGFLTSGIGGNLWFIGQSWKLQRVSGGNTTGCKDSQR